MKRIPSPGGVRGIAIVLTLFEHTSESNWLVAASGQCARLSLTANQEVRISAPEEISGGQFR